MGKFKNEAIRGWIILWELPESTSTVTGWLCIVAVKRRVLGDGWPVAACRDKWKRVESFCGGGGGFGSGYGVVGNSENGLGIWAGSGISEVNRAYSGFGYGSVSPS
jgi:hypothetical protein